MEKVGYPVPRDKAVSSFTSAYQFVHCDLKKSAGSKSTIEAAVYGLRWAHQVAGLESPTEHPIVQMAMEGARKQLGKPTVKKEPVTPEILIELVEKVGGARASLVDVRGLCICLLGYAGFLRHV